MQKKKQIILVRHAKGVELTEFLGMDFDRPLIDRGISAAKIIAKYLRLIGVKPDVIISSPAVRTRETAEILLDQYPKIGKIEYVPALYNGGALSTRDANEIHLKVVQKMKKDTEILMIVGHNNDLTEFAAYLSGESVPSMKKGSIAVLSLPDELDWSEVSAESAKFVYYLTPHFLRLEELT